MLVRLIAGFFPNLSMVEPPRVKRVGRASRSPEGGASRSPVRVPSSWESGGNGSHSKATKLTH